MVKRALILVALAAILVALAGCQTVAGFGRDLTGAATAVEAWMTR